MVADITVQPIQLQPGFVLPVECVPTWELSHPPFSFRCKAGPCIAVAGVRSRKQAYPTLNLSSFVCLGFTAFASEVFVIQNQLGKRFTVLPHSEDLSSGSFRPQFPWYSVPHILEELTLVMFEELCFSYLGTEGKDIAAASVNLFLELHVILWGNVRDVKNF